MARVNQEFVRVVGPLFGGVALLGFACVVFYGISVFAERDRIHKEKLKQAKADISSFIATRNEEFTSNGKLDPWGTAYELSTEESKEGVTTSYAARSAGPDQKLDTSDDIVEINSDLNWTNAGQAIGTRTGRATRGFFKGLWKSDDGK